MRLNPCFNGIWSASGSEKSLRKWRFRVLILVLMEYGMRERQPSEQATKGKVLILVLMEYGL